MEKIFYWLAGISLVFPGSIALLNLIKEGFSLYWLQFMIPTILFFSIASIRSYIRKKKNPV